MKYTPKKSFIKLAQSKQTFRPNRRSEVNPNMATLSEGRRQAMRHNPLNSRVILKLFSMR